MTTATLIFPLELPGMNEIVDAAKGCGGTGRLYSKMKKDFTNTIALMTRAQFKGAPFERYFLGFAWFFKDARKDPDNIIAAKKFILDGMVVGKALAGDTQKHFMGIDYECWSVDRSKKPSVRVIVTGAP